VAITDIVAGTFDTRISPNILLGGMRKKRVVTVTPVRRRSAKKIQVKKPVKTKKVSKKNRN